MDYCSDFRYELQLGQVGERQIGEMLNYAKIEVKTDLQALKTGNVFVEYESRGEPSGVARSEATWYAFILSDGLIRFIKTDILKEKCRKYLKTNRDKRGGDNNTSKGILLPLVDF